MQLRTFLHNMLGTWWSMWPSMCKTPWGSILTLLSKKGKGNLYAFSSILVYQTFSCE